MVINIGQGPWVPLGKNFPGARDVRAIHKNRRCMGRRLVRKQKGHFATEKLKDAWHTVCVHADGVATQVAKDGCEGYLGTDAITVGPGMADDGNWPAFEVRRERGEGRRVL